MTAVSLLETLTNRGAAVTVKNGRDGVALLCVTPRSAMAGLAVEIQQLKPELLELLTGNSKAASSPLRDLGEAILSAVAANGGRYSYAAIRPQWKKANDLTGANLTAEQLGALARAWCDGDESLTLPELPITGAQVVAYSLQSFLLLIEAARREKLPSGPLEIPSPDGAEVWLLENPAETVRTLEHEWTVKGRECVARPLNTLEVDALENAVWVLDYLTACWDSNAWVMPESSFNVAIEAAREPSEVARLRREARGAQEQGQEKTLVTVTRVSVEAATIEPAPIGDTSNNDTPHGYPESEPRKRGTVKRSTSRSEAAVTAQAPAEVLTLFGAMVA